MPANFTDEQITPTSATATDNAKTTSGGKTAQKVIIAVETNVVRMRIGINPTASVGVILQKDTVYEFSGFDMIDEMTFIDTGAGASIVNLQYILL